MKNKTGVVYVSCGLTQYFTLLRSYYNKDSIQRFTITMDVLACGIERNAPRAMLFALDLVVCEESSLEIDIQQYRARWRDV